MLKKTAVVECYLEHNLGDDLFLISLLKRYPGVQLIVFSDSSYQYLKHNFPNIDIIYVNNTRKKYLLHRLIDKFLSFIEKLKYVYRADVLITIGGSLYMEGTCKSLLSFVHKRISFLSDRIIAKTAKKHFVLGANFGPFYSKAFLNHYRKFFSLYCDDVCFREHFSVNLFSDLGNVRYAPDVLLTTKMPCVIKNDKVFISVVDLNNKKFGSLSRYASQYDNLIYNYIKKYACRGFEIVICSFCSSEGDDIAVDRIARKARKQGYFVKPLLYTDNFDEILREIASSKIVIGTRFHAIILGLVANAYVLPIVYSDKTTHVLDEFGWNMSCSIDLKSFFTSKESYLPCPQQMQITDIRNNAFEQFKALDSFFHI